MPDLMTFTVAIDGAPIAPDYTDPAEAIARAVAIRRDGWSPAPGDVYEPEVVTVIVGGD